MLRSIWSLKDINIKISVHIVQRVVTIQILDTRWQKPLKMENVIQVSVSVAVVKEST